MSSHKTQIQDGKRIVRVCSAQITSTWEDPERTLARVEAFTHHAADCGAKLICFPEQFATGWDPKPLKNIQDMHGTIISSLQGYAKKYRIGIIGSLREKHDQLPKNTAVAIDCYGQIVASYAKIHLFSFCNEHEGNTPGNALAIFDLDALRCGIAICYDLRFPELFRLYAQKGVHAVFVPSAWPKHRVRHWELFITARAAENQMYVLGVNTTGTTPIDQYSGASMTADPQGIIISRANEAEQLLFSDIDPGEVTRTRIGFPVENDRKDALYHSLLTTES
ncbi:MAG: carbon-nitrogen hydrolase family protein [Methanoregula sp.]|nr:carbon-nitrogen hydrolase family protein [Methanoregula sp.]